MSPAACVACLSLFWAGSGPDIGDGRFHLFLSGKARFMVYQALDGAARRLSTPACQRVLDDFQDDRGQRLSSVLAATGKTHVSFLSSLYFVDGEDIGPCTPYGVASAFTTPRQHVIRVCTSRFTDGALSNPKHMEMIVIHELLHALGLGENPPTSAQITAQVMRRCGG